MSGVLFIIWVPSEQHEKLLASKQAWESKPDPRFISDDSGNTEDEVSVANSF